ncbi:MAG: adenylate/guanylate cyclase domain-containing protein [Leptospiraceae bacterium]|nr:adenylate/guanylate cyclase domain-containing protein [Leptospiraceae bacterium]
MMLLSCSLSCSREEQTVEDGVLDGARIDGQSILRLNGPWKFVPGRFLSPEEAEALGEEDYVRTLIPGDWTTNLEKRPISSRGFGTYLLKVRDLPLFYENRTFAIDVRAVSTAYRLIIDGTTIARNGSLAIEGRHSRPDGSRRISLFQIDAGQRESLILFHVSNYEDLAGGFWSAPMMGPEEEIIAQSQRRTGLDFLLFGSLMIMGLYHLVLYLHRRGSLELILFAGLCMTLAVRSLLTGERVLYQFDWFIVHRLEYLTFFLSVALVPAYFERIYPDEYSRRIGHGIAAICGLFALSLFAPAVYYTRLLVPFQIFLILVIAYCLSGVVLSAWRRRDQAFLFVSGSLVFCFAALNDVLYNIGIVMTGESNLAPVGLIAFVLFQSSLLAAMFARAFKAVEELTMNLKRQSDSFARFVPGEFIQVLSRTDVSDVELGDARNIPMSVFFSDIRQFTEMSEHLGAQEIIQFLNDYLQRVEPHITGNGGFVDKFVGDAIMALFQDRIRSRQDSVKAGLDILTELADINRMRALTGSRPIAIGIGIHYGNVMLGTIGSQTRLDTTAVGDTVNTAARIETLTKLYRTEMLISQDVLGTQTDLMGPGTEASETGDRDFTSVVGADGIRPLDVVRLRGKTRPIQIYEVFQHRSEKDKDQILKQRPRFEEGRLLYVNKDFSGAAALFRDLARTSPSEHVYRLYYSRARRYEESPPGDDWDGVHSVR